MRKLNYSWFWMLGILFAFVGCTEEGPGGTSRVDGTTAHHELPIPGTKVYIQYGSLLSPGTDPALYDDSTTSDQNASFSFSGLQKGDYYIYGVGFDSTIGEVVKAGIPVALKSGENSNVILPVTE